MRSEEKVVSVIDPVTNNCSSEGYNFPPIVITDKSNLILKDNSVLREVRDKFECSPKMTGILKEFTDLYKEKLHRLNEAEGEEELKRKVSVLESWVSDLGEQNAILVGTVEDLEREAARRVELLQEKLDHMAVATRDSCVALTDHQGQMRCLVEEKHTLEAEMQHLREQHLVLKGDRSAFEDENDKLKDDLNSLIQVISRVRLTGRWDYSDLSFNSIRPQEIFGTELQSPAGSPCHESGDVFSSEICVQNDAEKIFRNSVTSLMSLEEEDLCIPKLRREIKTLKKNLSETNSVITSRDEHIAHLQCEVTSVHHDLSMSRSQMDRTTSTLDSLVDRGRHHSLEISRRDDVIRHLLSPTPQHFSEGGCDAEERDARGKNTDVVKKNGNTDVEGELSRNIDVLALRLQTSEAECEALRGQHAALTATHDRCHAPGHSRRVREDLEQCQKCLSEVKTELEESREEIEELRAELEEKEKVLESERRNWKRREKSSRSSLVSTQVQTDRVSDEFELPNLKLSKLENELSEKNILIRELQNHLVVSREELRLKDETLFNVEQKLLSSRRGCDEKEERTLYLTSQLTSLQLEVSRLHGTTQQLKMHLSNKSELVSKLESENRSLTQNHNEKSSLHEALSAQVRALTKEGHAKTKQISEQKLALSSVQETLVSATNEGHKLKAQIQSQNSCHPRSRSHVQRRIHKTHGCGCSRRARSSHLDEDPQVVELKLIIDELTSYLKEAGQMAQTVETESDHLVKTCRPNQAQAHTQSLQTVRNETSHLMSKLKNIKEDLMKCKTSDDFLVNSKTNQKFGPSNRMNDTSHRLSNENLAKRLSPQKEFHATAEVETLRSKLIKLEQELQKERLDKDMLSNDANAVVSSVRQWLHFQKAANSQLEEKFDQQQQEMLLLSKENQILNSTLRSYQFYVCPGDLPRHDQSPSREMSPRSTKKNRESAISAREARLKESLYPFWSSHPPTLLREDHKT